MAKSMRCIRSFHSGEDPSTTMSHFRITRQFRVICQASRPTSPAEFRENWGQQELTHIGYFAALCPSERVIGQLAVIRSIALRLPSPNQAVILSARGPARFLQRGGGKRRICFCFSQNRSKSE